MNTLQIITKAAHFAAVKHVHQRRKGERQEPYINHLVEVSEILAQCTDDQDVIVAGMLHDTLEDTETTYEELVQEFGVNIANIVREVTDDRTLPKAERKRLQVQNAPHKSDQAKMIKIADKISNLRSILNTPPAGWDNNRKREYFDWAKQVVDGCAEINGKLECKFKAVYGRL